MLTKKVAALVQRHGMRKYLANVLEFDARRSDQVMRDPQPQFRVYKNLALQKQIKMLTHGTRQRVLHRDHGGGGQTRIQRVKNMNGRGARSTSAPGTSCNAAYG